MGELGKLFDTLFQLALFGILCAFFIALAAIGGVVWAAIHYLF